MRSTTLLALALPLIAALPLDEAMPARDLETRLVHPGHGSGGNMPQGAPEEPDCPPESEEGETESAMPPAPSSPPTPAAPPAEETGVDDEMACPADGEEPPKEEGSAKEDETPKQEPAPAPAPSSEPASPPPSQEKKPEPSPMPEEATPPASPDAKPNPYPSAEPEAKPESYPPSKEAPPQPTGAAPTNGTPTNGSEPDAGAAPAEAKAGLALHNEYRALHSAPALAWDEGLAKMAQDWANGCKFEHGGIGQGIGQNLYASSGGMSSGGDYLSAPTKAWYSEEPEYARSGYKEPTSFGAAGHFTQVVWKGTSKLGCAQNTVQCGQTIVVCNYQQAGNMMGAYAQNVFPPTSSAQPTSGPSSPSGPGNPSGPGSPSGPGYGYD